MKTSTSIDSINKTTHTSIPLTTDRNFNLGNYQSFNSISVQVTWDTLVGTQDATVQLQQANLPELGFLDISGATATLGAASGSVILEVADFTSNFLLLEFELNTTTSVNLTINVIAKNK